MTKRSASGDPRVRTRRRGSSLALWIDCELTRPWNDPAKDIARKVQVRDGMFLVGVLDGQIVGTVMAGYDGHRGWVNYLAVDATYRRRGLAASLMQEAERRLLALGCPKINPQVRTTNSAAQRFYERIGYTVDDVVSLGRRFIEDDQPSS